MATAFALPALLYLSFRLESNTNDMLNWVPEDTAQSRVYQEFTELFGEDDELLISWIGCRIDDPRLAEFESHLSTSNRQHELFSTVYSGKSILAQLSGKKFTYPQETLKRRLRKIVFDEQLETTSVLIQLSEKGRRNGNQCIEQIYQQADLTPGLERTDLRIAGNTFTNLQIERSTQATILLAIPAIFIAVLFTYFCLKSLRLMTAAFLTAGTAALISLAVIAIAGLKFNSLLVMMPVLVIVLTFSATIHLCAYYKKCVRSNHADPIAGMLDMGYRPCACAVLTTAAGIAMLYSSHVQAIRTFGLFTAVGLVFSLLGILLIFPAILRVWKPNSSELNNIKKNSLENYFHIRIPSKALVSVSTLIVAVCLTMFPFFALGLSKINSLLLVERMFAESSAVSQNTKWLAEKFSTVHCVEVIAAFPGKVEESDLLDEIRQIRSIQARLARLGSVESTMSVVNFCRIPPRRTSAKQFVQSEIINESLKHEIQHLKDRRLVAETDDQTYWRIRLGIDDEYAHKVEEVMDNIAATFEKAAAKTPDQPTGFVSGTWPMYTAGRHHMFYDLANSFVLAFLVITPILMILMRGVCVGLVAMVPNVLPALAFFGALGWLGIEIDTGTILTACVGLGIAVDDTMHYLHEYIRIRKSEKIGRTAGAVAAVTTCLRPMTYTTIICTIGLSIFVFSEFLPAQNFAIAICFLLVLALLCDIIFLPALIIGPFGKLFECKRLFACESEPVELSESEQLQQSNELTN